GVPSNPLPPYVLDLGGGGASLQNPRGLMTEGDLIEVSFSGEIGAFTIVARVLRVSRRRGVMSVEFEHRSPEERNRIMRFLSAQAERRRPHAS
ncbi:MAG TPA: PilZ domain-containing protein, partial [Spirochaetia bacterium]|nr:PilZ domain-containing protein [Spirochaetia bacterium]